MSSLINASTSSGLIQTADTSGTLELQSNGTTQLTVSSTGAYGQLKSATAQASTSGTSIDFTSIPSWVKRITVMLNGVSTSGTSNYQIQIGAGSVITSGYTGQMTSMNSAGSAAILAYTNGFCVYNTGSASASVYGHAVLTLVSGNIWIYSSNILSTDPRASVGSGGYPLSGTLDRIRVTTVNGTDTFDAGSINILYEG
jgi:hypothetical protein